jgi:hypothetical protein
MRGPGNILVVGDGLVAAMIVVGEPSVGRAPEPSILCAD